MLAKSSQVGRWLVVAVAAGLIIGHATILNTSWQVNMTNVETIRSPQLFDAGDMLSGIYPAVSQVISTPQIDPQSGSQSYLLWQSLGRTQWTVGHYAEAIVAWKKASELAPQNAIMPRFYLALALYTTGEHVEAVRQLKELRAGGYIYESGRQAVLAKDLPTAHRLYELSLEVELNPKVAAALVEVYELQGAVEEAAQLWRKIATLTSEQDSIHWLAIAETATRAGQWTDARTALERALNLADVTGADTFDLRVRLGKVLTELGDSDGALKVYAEAIRLRPLGFTQPYFLAAGIELNRGNYEAALSWYARAQAVTSALDPWPNLLAGQAALRFNQPGEAEKRILAAYAISPHDFNVLHELAWLEYRRGHLARAMNYMSQAVEALPAQCAAWRTLEQWQRESTDQPMVEVPASCK